MVGPTARANAAARCSAPNACASRNGRRGARRASHSACAAIHHTDRRSSSSSLSSAVASAALTALIAVNGLGAGAAWAAEEKVIKLDSLRSSAPPTVSAKAPAKAPAKPAQAKKEAPKKEEPEEKLSEAESLRRQAAVASKAKKPSASKPDVRRTDATTKKGKVKLVATPKKVKNFAQEGPALPSVSLPSLPGAGYKRGGGASDAPRTSGGPSFSFSFPSFTAPSVSLPSVGGGGAAPPGESAQTQALAVLVAEVVLAGAAASAVGSLTKD